MVHVLRKPVTHAELCFALDKSGKRLAQMLQNLVSVDLERGRPVAAALVVNAKTQRPGSGFYLALARYDKRVDTQHTDTALMEQIWLSHVQKFPSVNMPSA
jgi:hypothetical protein